jgi:hypothetical protein
MQTQCERIVDVLRSARDLPQAIPDGQFGWQEDGWVAIEEVCALPSGGRIMDPFARLSELSKRGYVIERRRRPRFTSSSRSYTATDLRLVSEPVTPWV